MTTVAEVVAFIEAQSLGTFGTDLFANVLPDTPASAIAIMETPGLRPEHTHPGTRYDRPRFQVLVRATSSEAGRALAGQLYRAMDTVRNQTIGEVRYLALWPLQPPFLLKRDDNDRPVFAFNVEAHKHGTEETS